MNPSEAVEPLARITKPLPWDLADFVAYFLLGALSPASFYMAIEGVPAFLDSATRRPLAWSVLGAIFAYPVGVTLNSIGRVVREFILRWKPDERYKITYDRLGNRITELARALDHMVFAGKQVGGDIGWFLDVAIVMAPKHIPGATGALHRQASFYRHHTTMLAFVCLNSATLVASSILRLTGVLDGLWAPYAGAAVAGGLLGVLTEYVAREQNDHVLELQTAIAAALLAELSRGADGPSIHRH